MLATLAPVLSGVGVAPVTSSYYSIATQTLGSGGASTVTFSSIPSTYSHLQIRAIARQASGTGEAYGKLNFNSDSTSGNYYALHQLYGDGSSANASVDSSSTYMQTGYFPPSTALANVYGDMVLDILDYANTNKYKTVRNLSGFDVNGSGGFILFRSGLWQQTSAITRIDLTVSNGIYAQYSSFALYGVK
jgi:hypothetical protein